MKITWLGHSGFRIEIGNQVLLVDPWLTGNPMFPEDRHAEAVAGATHILITHGHGDHSGDALAISRETGAPLVGIYDLMSWWGEQEGVETIGFNKGGTITLGDVEVTMVNAVHSSSISGANEPIYTGVEAGFMITHNGRTIYVSGDTEVTADMKIMNDLHHPEVGILSSGGYFTMDMRRAAYAAKTFFNFKTVIPCHYKTFPILEQSAKLLKDELIGVNVIEPEVLDPILLVG